MKRIFLTAVAAMICVAPVMSQSATKVDKEDFLKKISRSDEDIANPKKNGKANVWLDRGKLFTEAAGKPASALYHEGMDANALQLFYGTDSQNSTKVIGNTEYEVRQFPNVTVYLANGVVAFWEPTLVIADNALEEAYNSYAKAYEVDSKSSSKVRNGIIEVTNELRKDAQNYYGLQQYQKAADAFYKSYEYQLHPALNLVDTASLYNSGMFYTHAEDYPNAIKSLEKALDYNFESNGDTYYYLYFSLYGQNDLARAREVLMEGIQKYPGNSSIVEALIGLYTTTDGDPKEIIPIVEKSIADDPNNPVLYSGLGGIYHKLKDYDKAVESFQKAVELGPDDFYNTYRLGLSYIEIADDMVQELNSSNLTSQAEYNKALEEINTQYGKSIAPLEKALALQPNEPAVVELLKNVSFRLRDEPGMMEKYNLYNEMFQNLPQ